MFLITVPATLFLAQGCNSPLSDADDLQPGQLRVRFEVVKERRESTGSVTPYVEARFFDSKDRRVELKHGHVFLNNVYMNKNEAFGGQVYYRLSGGGLTFGHDSTYVFRVVLDTASGVGYESSVRTQVGDMLQSTRVLNGDSASFTWQGDATLPVRLTYTLRKNLDSTTETESRTITFQPPHVQPLRIPMEGYDTITRHELESVVNGTIHQAFHSGSIESMVRLVK